MLWLYEVPFWANGVLLVVPLFIATEIGFRMGLRRHRQRRDAAKSTRGDVTLGSMLALLGLMLVIIDFDRSKAGLIRVSNKPLESVIHEMKNASGASGGVEGSASP